MDDVIGRPTRHRLDVDAYYRMAEVGILAWNDRVELIDGELIDMAPIGSDHAATVDGLTEALVTACAGQAIVRVQGPVRLDPFNEPQPDFSVLRLRTDRYRTGHPGPADVLLLIEVADSSLRFDKKIKLPMYARAGIGEVWIVDLKRRKVEAYSSPAAGEYAPKRPYGPGHRVALALKPEIVVSLDRAF